MHSLKCNKFCAYPNYSELSRSSWVNSSDVTAISSVIKYYINLSLLQKVHKFNIYYTNIPPSAMQWGFVSRPSCSIATITRKIQNFFLLVGSCGRQKCSKLSCEVLSLEAASPGYITDNWTAKVWKTQVKHQFTPSFIQLKKKQRRNNYNVLEELCL
jgi:hypothetical protein